MNEMNRNKLIKDYKAKNKKNRNLHLSLQRNNPFLELLEAKKKETLLYSETGKYLTYSAQDDIPSIEQEIDNHFQNTSSNTTSNPSSDTTLCPVCFNNSFTLNNNTACCKCGLEYPTSHSTPHQLLQHLLDFGIFFIK